jgi:hypothetical protein
MDETFTKSMSQVRRLRAQGVVDKHLDEENRKLAAENAAMRAALETVKATCASRDTRTMDGLYRRADEALSTDAGKALVEDLRLCNEARVAYCQRYEASLERNALLQYRLDHAVRTVGCLEEVVTGLEAVRDAADKVRQAFEHAERFDLLSAHDSELLTQLRAALDAEKAK